MSCAPRVYPWRFLHFPFMRPTVRHLLRQIRNSNRTMIARTGEISGAHIAVLINDAMRTEETPGSTILGLAEFIGAALDGEIMDIDAPLSASQFVASR